MPPENPQDECSHLPTADSTRGLSPKQQLWQSQQNKARTRIGPAQPGQTAQQNPVEPPAPAPELSREWQELLEMEDPEIHLPPLHTPAPTNPPTPVGPRRSLIARKSPPPEPAPEPAPAPEPKPEPASPKAAPRRSLIARRSELPAEPPPAPAPQAAEKPAPETPNHPAPAKEPPKSKSAAPKRTHTAPEPARASTPSPKPPQAKPQTKPQPEPLTSSDSPAPDEDKSPDAPKPEKPTSAAKPPDTPDTSNETGLAVWGRKYWNLWGGRALAASLAVHALLLFCAAWVVVSQVQEKQVDFLSGGGTQQGAEAAAALQHRIQQKKNPWLKKPVPMRKLAVANSLNSLVLPDDVPDLLTIPEASSLLGGGKLGGGMGLAGSGGGFGKGMGIGGASGVNFQPFSLFGMQVRAKKLAAVLDVSGSMAPHLPRVIAEVDKVAKGSVVVLYIGCGIEPPPPRGLEGKNVISTNTPDFEKFWRLLWQTGGATQAEARSYRPPAGEPIQNEEIFNLLKRRPRTYFIFSVGIRYAWLALLSDQVREADGLYWFSDFQDPVNFGQLGIVRDNLIQRKQRLYAHSYYRGGSFDLVKSMLVETTKGDYVLEE